MKRTFRTIDDIPLAGKRVFVRADFNVPMSDGRISDDTRIRATLPGLRRCLDAGAAVCVASHLGRPQPGQCREADSLAPVAVRLAELLGQPVALQTDWVEGRFELRPGALTLLENCRCNPGETTDDTELARTIARWIDVYVNEAFGTAHRRECTLHALALAAPEACAGPLLAAELDALGRALERPARPLLAVVGGSKVSTKLGVLESLAEKVDALIVGGGIANTFLAAAGHPIGKSLHEPGLLKAARAVAATLKLRGKTLWLPQDVRVANRFATDAEASTRAIGDIASDEMILDIGPVSCTRLDALLRQAGTIVWNGPLGVFEMPRFAAGTRALAEGIARAPGFSIAGGGDTLAAIAQFGVAEGINYISTGGGVFLEYLEGRELPAVAALTARRDAATGDTPAPATIH